VEPRPRRSCAPRRFTRSPADTMARIRSAGRPASLRAGPAGNGLRGGDGAP
jgi:hypothetical protein